MTTTGTPDLKEIFAGYEPLRGRNVALVVTGSLSASFAPYWVNFVRNLELGLNLRVIVTGTAETMVSPRVLSALSGSSVQVDRWVDDDSGHAPHIELAQWADAVLVHPCTFSYLAKLAVGLADTPTMLAIQCSSLPLVVCPALPPGGDGSPSYARHVAALGERPATRVLPPSVGSSAATGKQDGLPPAPFPDALSSLVEVLEGVRA